MKTRSIAELEELIANEDYGDLNADEVKKVIMICVTNAVSKRVSRTMEKQRDTIRARNAASQRTANVNQLKLNRRIEAMHEERMQKIEQRMREIRNG